MTSRDIEEALKTITEHNKDLTQEKLSFLLDAAGWNGDDKAEALTLFSTKKGKEPTKEGYAIAVASPSPLPEVVTAKDSFYPSTTQAVVDIAPTREEVEIKKEKMEEEETGLPYNLPLKPLDTDPGAVPFHNYKDLFGPKVEVMPTKETVKAEENAPKQGAREVHVATIVVPKSDRSLVITAIGMFLVLMLLLGYMYSNGRL